MRILRTVSLLLSTSKNKVFQSTLIYTIAGGFNAAVPFFILPFLTSYLSPEQYGVVSTFMVFNSIFLILVGLEQYSYISVNFYTTSKDIICSYVTGIAATGFCSFLVISLTIISLPAFFTDVSQIELRWIIFSVVVAFFQFLAQLSLTVWQLENRPLSYGLFQVFHSLCNYGLSIFLIIQFGMNEDGRIVGISIAAVLFGCYSLYDLFKKRLISFNVKLDVIKAAILFSLPLIPHAFAGWVNTALDRLIINNYVGVAENGIYSINYQIAMVIGLVAGSFNRAFIPYVYKTLSAGSDEGKLLLVKYTYAYYIALIGMAFLIALGAPWILSLLVDEQYHHDNNILYWIIIGFTADGLYYGVINYLFYIKKTAYISLITFTSCIIHFLVSITLIPKFGFVAAAWSTAISFVFSFVFAFILSSRHYPMPWFFFLRRNEKIGVG